MPLHRAVPWFVILALASPGCGGSAETSTTGSAGAGGQTTTEGAGGQISTGAGGQATTGGAGGTAGSGGAGGSSTTTSSTGGSAGAGGAGGCTDACITNVDCPADLPVCTNLRDCNVCLGPCSGAGCVGGNTCISDADCPPPDGKCVCGEDGCTMCALGFSGGPPGFPEALGEGVWLIGWSGGLDHYSWVRFTFQTPTTGMFTLLDAEGLTLTPFYQCEGSGAFSVHLGTAVVTLELPPACNQAKSYLDVLSLGDPGGFPPHAVLAADLLAMGQYIAGFQHLASFCDAGFTTCGDPFQP